MQLQLTVLDLILELHALRVMVKFIVSDNDSTIRAHLQHVCTINNGKLSLDVSQLSFLCDPSNPIKMIVTDIFALALQSKATSECKNIDAMRLTTYVGYMIGKTKILTFEQFKKNIQSTSGTLIWL